MNSKRAKDDVHFTQYYREFLNMASKKHIHSQEKVSDHLLYLPLNNKMAVFIIVQKKS